MPRAFPAPGNHDRMALDASMENGRVTKNETTILKQGGLFDVDSPLHGRVRGERSLMDFPFFSLSKKAVVKPMQYQLGDIHIEIRPSSTGLATMYDKEIILYIASLMAQKMARGETVEQEFTFTAHDFFRITGVARPGKRDYDRFGDALERLQGTQIKTNIETASQIERGWFSWLSEAQAAYTRLPNGEEQLQAIKVRLCHWLYRAIQRDGKIYSYHHDYFRLGTIERRLYEIAHCHCDGEPVEFPLDYLALKVGSTSSPYKFKHLLKDVESQDRLPEYTIELCDVVKPTTYRDARGHRRSTVETMVVLKPRPNASSPSSSRPEIT